MKHPFPLVLIYLSALICAASISSTLTLLSILLSPGGSGGSFHPRSFCETQLPEHPRCRLPLPAANPPHTSVSVIPRLPPGRLVEGSRPSFCTREAVPAVVSGRARSGSQAGLEQDGCLRAGGPRPHLRNWWVDSEVPDRMHSPANPLN